MLHRSQGQSYDTSEMGAFILANTCPPVGVEVNYKMYLSPSPGASGEEFLEGVGKILRVEQAHGGEGRNGFAILSQQAFFGQK